MWRIRDLCPRRGSVSARSLALGGGRVAGYRAIGLGDILCEFEKLENFQITGVIAASAQSIAV